MRTRLMLVTVLALLFSAIPAFAQAGGGGGGGGGGGRGGRGGMGMGMAGLTTDPAFAQLVSALGECNLAPDFTLTADQKQALKSIRDDVKAAQDKWRTDHAADITKLQADMQAARGGGGGDMQAVMQKMTELRNTRPSTVDAQAAIKKLLTADQAKAVDAKVEELRAATPGRGGRGGGAGGV
jgi:Spy/CpxP family protein refolding chaperone